MMPARKPGQLVDGAALRSRLAGLEPGGDLRKRVVDILKETLASARAEAERRLMADGKGTQCAMLLAEAQDEIIHSLFDLALKKLYRASNPSEAERITVVAVGGYGRGTLAPGSDIDLLFLLPYKQTGWSESVIEFILYSLWDTRLKVGHATRSVDDCIRLAQSDSTILTSILEARFICGEPSLFETLTKRFRKEIAAKGAKAFVASKLIERDERHFKAGESRYLVEPDVKNGKGGLRDLHTLFWIAKFLSGANSTAELAEQGVFAREELALFEKSEDFLWAVRCHLHFLAKRAEDRLSFDRQPDLAERLGYKAHGGLKHVERFMKHYFLVAKDVGDLTRIFSASLEARQMKATPVFGRMLGRFAARRPGHIEGAPDFRIEANRLTIADEKTLTATPVNMIALFALAADKDLEIHPDALKAVRRNLARIDKTLCADAQANALFLTMLTEARDPETALRRMNEAGVLGRFIPEFGRIVAMMQFNMYHHYTVDEHLIRAVGILAAIERGRFSSDHPLSTEIFPTVSSRRVLYVAVLLHDIAKGRKESHSIAGDETETVAWLIRHHLLMSETAQMRDLNDFKTILDFANVVQSPERLKLLLILTVADIRAVGPSAWNGWKGQLLRTLYFETEPVLSGGHTSISRKERVAEAQAKFFAHYPQWTSGEKAAYAARHYDAYWLNVDTDRQVAHERLMARARAEGEPVATEVRTDEFTAITELTIHAPDHPRFLALITGACAAANANIAGAQIFTTADSLALDTILIQRQFANSEDERRRAERVASLVRQVRKGEVRIKELIARVKHPETRLQAFTVSPRVIIDNESSNRFTVIEVNGLDRVGFLYDLTEALYHLNLNIGSAHITTYGERVIDVFYVTDLTGAKILSAARSGQIERQLLAVLGQHKS
ncbi:MAG: [protein-PII] uridylyltransferase [Alphaproteobacteria bacterium]|nr:MAG: [protein-PII] uridylyltransferase [Alphaproteobacteria bacterium]